MRKILRIPTTTSSIVPQHYKSSPRLNKHILLFWREKAIERASTCADVVVISAGCELVHFSSYVSEKSPKALFATKKPNPLDMMVGLLSNCAHSPLPCLKLEKTRPFSFPFPFLFRRTLSWSVLDDDIISQKIFGVLSGQICALCWDSIRILFVRNCRSCLTTVYVITIVLQR